ncbi:hypothetical protein K439DRAFT_921123 [Ramaria rubella]|nr:hypothetical protein K439DRAFT_921123 [Ramaria rubella]
MMRARDPVRDVPGDLERALKSFRTHEVEVSDACENATEAASAVHAREPVHKCEASQGFRPLTPLLPQHSLVLCTGSLHSLIAFPFPLAPIPFVYPHQSRYLSHRSFPPVFNMHSLAIVFVVLAVLQVTFSAPLFHSHVSTRDVKAAIPHVPRSPSGPQTIIRLDGSEGEDQDEPPARAKAPKAPSKRPAQEKATPSSSKKARLNPPSTSRPTKIRFQHFDPPRAATQTHPSSSQPQTLGGHTSFPYATIRLEEHVQEHPQQATTQARPPSQPATEPENKAASDSTKSGAPEHERIVDLNLPTTHSVLPLRS